MIQWEYLLHKTDGMMIMEYKHTLSVVILSYNTKEITRKAIDKAKKSARFAIDNLKALSIEIIVVDNHSTDGTVEMIREQYKDIQLFAMGENVGVAGGYNVGMENATSPLILLINNDTYLFERTLYDCLSFMRTRPQADVVIGKLYDGNKQPVSYGGALPTPLRTILWILGFESMPIIKHYLQRIYRTNEVYDEEMLLGWIPTCFFLLRREVFEQTGGEDENIFFYMEDVEFCKRITDKGFKIVFTPAIEAIHLGGKASKDKWKIQQVLESQFNGLLYYQKKHHAQYLNLVKIFLLIGLKMRVLAYYILGNKDMAEAYNNIEIYE